MLWLQTSSNESIEHTDEPEWPDAEFELGRYIGRLASWLPLFDDPGVSLLDSCDEVSRVSLEKVAGVARSRWRAFTTLFSDDTGRLTASEL